MELLILFVSIAVAVLAFRFLKPKFEEKGHKSFVAIAASASAALLAFVVVLVVLLPGEEPKSEETGEMGISTKWVEPESRENPYDKNSQRVEYEVISAFGIAFESYFGKSKESGIRGWGANEKEWFCEYETTRSGNEARLDFVGDLRTIFADLKSALRMLSRYKESGSTELIRFAVYGRHSGSEKQAEKLVELSMPWELFYLYNWENLSVDEIWDTVNDTDEYGNKLATVWIHPGLN